MLVCHPARHHPKLRLRSGGRTRARESGDVMRLTTPRQIVTFCLLNLFLAGSAPAAVAVSATVTTGVHLRAGPAIVYPSVVILQPSTTVQVFGCEQDYNWCDVQIGASRGWVDAAFLQVYSPSGPVLVASSAPMLGLPIVPFSFNSYWSTYYVAQPWYGRRAYYFTYWNRYPHGVPPPIYRPPPLRPPVRPPTIVRPPPRPPAAPGRPPPPGGSRPPGGRPPGSGSPGSRPPSARPTGDGKTTSAGAP